MGPHTAALVTFTVAFNLVTEAYKAPSPPEMCESMIPLNMRDIPPQTSDSPYRLSVSHTQIRSGSHLDITLTSNTTKEIFRGFMLQVRDENTTKPFGMFVRTNNAKWLYCSPGKKNVLANCNDHVRIIVKTTWACPPRFKGWIHAIATIVRNETEYWLGHQSHTVRVGQFHGVRLKGYDIHIDRDEEYEILQAG